MPTISSHVLNAEDGTHVSGLTITLYSLKNNSNREVVFKKKTDHGGRLNEIFLLEVTENDLFELEFKVSDIFKEKSMGIHCSDLIFRISMKSPAEKFHIPVIISKHGASTWWSGE
jgi:5-hydroxyisourate hydrolase-like protein (transthyretin family)